MSFTYTLTNEFTSPLQAFADDLEDAADALHLTVHTYLPTLFF